MFKRKKVSKPDEIGEFKQQMFNRIVYECIEKATEFTGVRINKKIDFRDSYADVLLEAYIYEDYKTTIIRRKYCFRDWAHLIVTKDDFIECIKNDIVKKVK